MAGYHNWLDTLPAVELAYIWRPWLNLVLINTITLTNHVRTGAVLKHVHFNYAAGVGARICHLVGCQGAILSVTYTVSSIVEGIIIKVN